MLNEWKATKERSWTILDGTIFEEMKLSKWEALFIVEHDTHVAHSISKALTSQWLVRTSSENFLENALKIDRG